MRNIQGVHCESCGSQDPENISNLIDTEGYTRCCNEPLAYPFKQEYSYRTGKYTDVPTDCAEYGQCYHD